MRTLKAIILLLLVFYSLPTEASKLSLDHICCKKHKPTYQRIAIKLSIRIGSRVFNRQLRKDRKQRLRETENDTFYTKRALNYISKSFRFYEIDSPLLKMSSLELTEDLKLRFKMPSIREYTDKLFKIESDYKTRTKLRFKANLGSRFKSPTVQVKFTHSIESTNHKFVFQIRLKYRVPEENLILTGSIKVEF